MKYKDLSLEKINSIENMIKQLEFSLSRNLFNEVPANISSLKNKIEELKKMLEIEDNKFGTDKIV